MTSFILGEKDLPTAWFNLLPRLPVPLDPPLHPAHQRAGRARRPDAAVPDGADRPGDERRSVDRHPGRGARHPAAVAPDAAGARRAARGGARARPARIYFKDESVSPAGSHKPNTAVPQAFYNKQEGIPRLTTETGAGQWGSALSFACAQFGLECMVYMVRASFEQKPYRKTMMEIWGGNVVPSPVDDPEQPRLARRGDLRRRARRGHARRLALRARLGAQPRAAAPDDHRARGQGAARAWRGSGTPTS